MRNTDRSTGDELAVGNTAGEDLGAAAKRRPPRRWPADEKARIVLESMAPGVRVCEVAHRNGVALRRLSEWRNLARRGELALPSSARPAFAALEIEDAPESASTPSASTGPVATEARGVTVRIGGDASVARIAEIAAALRGLR